MTTPTSKLKSLCKLALAASVLLGAAQWANAADKTPVADGKPSAAKGIKDPAVKGGCYSPCEIHGKVARPGTTSEQPTTAKGAKTQ